MYLTARSILCRDLILHDGLARVVRDMRVVKPGVRRLLLPRGRTCDIGMTPRPGYRPRAIPGIQSNR
ncbi:hypothetical protein ACWGJ2_00815 [Streptomyces sp. NPDC054796]